jgi:hypothetical protein
MKEKQIYIVADSIDSNVLVESGISSETIITLTPDAFYTLKDSQNKIIRSNELFSNEEHEVVARTVQKQESKLIKEIERSESLSLATKEIYINQIHAALSVFYLITHTIPDAHIYKVFQNREFLDFKLKEDACLCLINRLVHGRPFVMRANKAWFPSLINKLNDISSNILTKRNTYVFSTFLYGTPWISKEILNIDQNARFISFVSTKGTRVDLLRSISTLTSIILGMKFIKFVIPHSSYSNLNEFEEIIKNIEDKQAIEALKCFEEAVNKRASLANSSSKQISKLIKKITPVCMIAHEMRSPMIIASALAAKNNKIPVYLASHGTHLSSDNEIINLEQKSLARGILASPLADYMIVQSDMSKEAMKNFYPELEVLDYKQINWGFPNDYIDTSSKEKIRFLHASTYKSLGAFRPWIFETSDEFHKSLCELIQVFNKIESADLLIRHREIGEMSINTYKDVIKEKNQNIFIKTDQDNPFLEDLESADVVIANFSTTIEEALNIGKYVILWGEGNRYSHENCQYVSQELVFPAHSIEDLYNNVNLIIKEIRKKKNRITKGNTNLKNSQKEFIKRIALGR